MAYVVPPTYDSSVSQKGDTIVYQIPTNASVANQAVLGGMLGLAGVALLPAIAAALMFKKIELGIVAVGCVVVIVFCIKEMRGKRKTVVYFDKSSIRIDDKIFLLEHVHGIRRGWPGDNSTGVLAGAAYDTNQQVLIEYGTQLIPLIDGLTPRFADDAYRTVKACMEKVGYEFKGSGPA